MEFGLHLPSAQVGANADAILEVATGAERLGFDAVWMFDHLFTPVDLVSKYPYSPTGDYALTAEDPFFDPLGLFGVVAGATERVKMATGVLIPAYRHPIVLGKTLATIERFAPGRIVLGIGAGWMKEEFEAVNVTFERKGARFEEYIRALRAVWSGGPVSFEGEFYSWVEAGFEPGPTRPIPLIVGGHGERALERAARLGDGWAAVTVPGQGKGIDGIAARIEVLRGLLEKEGRDPADFLITFQHALWFSDSPNPKLPFTGPADAIAGSIKRLEELGVTMIDLIVFGPPPVILEHGQRFQEEVRSLL